MALAKEELQTILDGIRTTANNVDVTSALLKVEQEYSVALTELDTAVQKEQTVTIERDKYAKLNNELWIKNNQQPLDKLEQLGSNGIHKETNNNDTPPQKLSFDDLKWE